MALIQINAAKRPHRYETITGDGFVKGSAMRLIHEVIKAPRCMPSGEFLVRLARLSPAAMHRMKPDGMT